MKHWKINKKKLKKWCGWSVLFLLVLVCTLDFIAETGGFSDFFSTRLAEKAASQGLNCEVESVRAGFVNGLRINHLRITAGEDAGRAALEFRKIVFDPSVRKSLYRRQWIGELTLANGSFQSAKTENSRRFEVNDIRVNARLKRKEVILNEAVGFFLGIRLDAEGIVSHDFLQKTNGDLLAAFGLQDLLQTSGNAKTGTIPKTIERISNILTGQSFPKGQASVSLSIHLAKTETPRIKCFINLPDLFLESTAVRMLRTDIVLLPGRVSVPYFAALVDKDNFIKASGGIDTKQQKLNLSASGALHPYYLFELFNLTPPQKMGEISIPNPIRFDIEAEDKGFDLQNISAEGMLSTENMVARNIPLRKVKAKGRISSGNITLDKAEVQINSRGAEETIVGKGSFDAESGMITGEVSGNCRLIRTMKHLDLFPPMLNFIDSGDTQKSDSFRVVFNDCRPSKGIWEGQGNLEINSLRIQELEMGSLKTDLQLKEGILSIENFLMRPLGEPKKYLSGSVKFNFCEKTIASALKANVSAKNLSALFRSEGLQNIIARFGNSSVEVDATLPETSWSPSDWLVKGKLNVIDGEFSGLKVFEQSCSIEVRASRALLEAKNVQTSEGIVENLWLEVTENGNRIKIKGNGAFDPRMIRVFIINQRASEGYANIWSDFQWEKNNYPDVALQNFDCFDGPELGDWEISSGITIDGSSFSYRGVPVEQLKGLVKLELPQKVNVNLDLETKQKERVNGKLIFHLTGVNGCKLKCSGVVDPWTIVGAVDSQWKKYQPSFHADERCEMKLEGFIPFRPIGTLRLDGWLKTPSANVKNLRFTDSYCTWRLDNMDLMIKHFSGFLYEGKAKGAGHYDFLGDTGAVNLKLKNVNLAELMPNGDSQHEGFVTADADLIIDNTDDDKGLQLFGPGDFQLTEGNIWHIPIFKQLGNLLTSTIFGKISGLGKISELKTKLEFKGERVHFPAIQTNGTIISLKGNGNYAISERSPDVQIQGILLKKTFIIPWATKLFSWLFEAELRGTLDNPQWRLSRTSGDSEDSEKPSETIN